MPCLSFPVALALSSLPGSPRWGPGATPAPSEILAPRGSLSEGVELLAPARIADHDRLPLRVKWACDGSFAAYVGYRGDDRFPVLHGDVITEGEAYDFANPPRLAPEAPRVAFRVGRRVGPREEKWWVWLDGEPMHEEDWIGALAFSRDGEGLAYWAQPGARLDDTGAYESRQLILRHIGGKTVRRPMEWDEATALTPPVFDSGKPYSFALENGQWFAVGRGRKRFEALSEGYTTVSGLQVARGGKTIAFGAQVYELQRGNRQALLRVVVGEEHLASSYVATYGPALSPDGKHVAYKYVSWAPLMGICIDKETGKEPGFHYVSQAVWSPKGKRVAFVSVADAEGVDPRHVNTLQEYEPREGSWQLSLMERKGGAVTTGPKGFERLRSLTFGPDGERVAARALSEEGWHMVLFDLEGQVVFAGPGHDEVGIPRWTEAGLAYGVRDDRELAWALVSLE